MEQHVPFLLINWAKVRYLRVPLDCQGWTGAFEALLQVHAIPGLSESLTDWSPTKLRMVLARLRSARLLTGEDPHNPRHLDTHPLVREYFGERLKRGEREPRTSGKAQGG